MSDTTSEERPTYEAAKATIAVKGAPPLADGTRFDKEPPTGPPNPKKLAIPKHLERIVGFFNGIVMDESLLLDLCMDRCMELVQRNVESRIFGSDNFVADGQGGGSGPFTPAHYAVVAGPLAIELYKQALEVVKGREKEYEKLLEEATREREKNSPGGPRIVLPS